MKTQPESANAELPSKEMTQTVQLINNVTSLVYRHEGELRELEINFRWRKREKHFGINILFPNRHKFWFSCSLEASLLVFHSLTPSCVSSRSWTQAPPPRVLSRSAVHISCHQEPRHSPQPLRDPRSHDFLPSSVLESPHWLIYVCLLHVIIFSYLF